MDEATKAKIQERHDRYEEAKLAGNEKFFLDLERQVRNVEILPEDHELYRFVAEENKRFNTALRNADPAHQDSPVPVIAIGDFPHEGLMIHNENGRNMILMNRKRFEFLNEEGVIVALKNVEKMSGPEWIHSLFSHETAHSVLGHNGQSIREARAQECQTEWLHNLFSFDKGVRKAAGQNAGDERHVETKYLRPTLEKARAIMEESEISTEERPFFSGMHYDLKDCSPTDGWDAFRDQLNQYKQGRSVDPEYIGQLSHPVRKIKLKRVNVTSNK